jgi:hypothetical protein
MELDTGCYITDQEGTGLFNFPDVENLMLTTSQDFAELDPTIILGDDNRFTELRTSTSNYEVLTFHSCEQTVCSNNVNTESVPDHLFLGEGNWNGVEGPITVDKEKTYIMNVCICLLLLFFEFSHNFTIGSC